MQPNLVVVGGQKLMLEDLILGQLAAPTLALFINDINPGKQAVLVDFTAAAFTGSAPVALVFGTAYLNANGDWEVVSQRVEFTWTAGGPETVFGCIVKSVDVGLPLLFYFRLDSAKIMRAIGDSLGIVVKFTFSGLGMGVSIQVT